MLDSLDVDDLCTDAGSEKLAVISLEDQSVHSSATINRVTAVEGGRTAVGSQEQEGVITSITACGNRAVGSREREKVVGAAASSGDVSGAPYVIVSGPVAALPSELWRLAMFSAVEPASMVSA